MKFSVWLFRCALAVLVCAALTGCEPTGQGQLDEEKEPHYIEGMRALNSYDYTGAIEEFEKAVEADPHNASAHFELGCLYEGNRQEGEQDPKDADPAAAIYHYEQFLKLRPNAAAAEQVKQRIANCKVDLARAVLPLPATAGVQHDLEQLIEENKQLRAQLDQWQAYFKTLTNHPAPVAADLPRNVTPTAPPPPPVTRTNPAPVGWVYNVRGSPHPAAMRAYVVQARDTLASISRKYNVKLSALASANPGIDARKLRPGQTVNIP